MMFKVKITRNYQVTIPAPIRDKLGLRVGESLIVRLEGERIIIERPRVDIGKLGIRLGRMVDWRHIEDVVVEAAEEVADESGG